jgi:hypothetical protein
MGARGLDHLVLGVADLDVAGRLYERLGFQVGPVNQHPWGTRNRLVQFPGTFLELLAVPADMPEPETGAREFSFGGFMRDALKRGEGLAMLVLESEDGEADAKTFAASGIGDFKPFTFRRMGRDAAGQLVEVAFTLAFARDPLAPHCGFFSCRQHRPDLFWNAALQHHANGATGVSSVVMIADNPSDHHVFLKAFSGVTDLVSTSMGVGARLPRGMIEIASPQAGAFLLGTPEVASRPEPSFAGFCVQIPDTAALAGRLSREGIAYRSDARGLSVGPDVAHGVAIRFQSAA